MDLLCTVRIAELAYYLVLLKAYSLLPAQVAQPINYTWSIVLLLMLTIFSMQKINCIKHVGMVISLVGVCLISFGNAESRKNLSLNGILLAFLSAFMGDIQDG